MFDGKLGQLNTMLQGECQTHLSPMVPKSGPSTDGDANLTDHQPIVNFDLYLLTIAI